MLHTMPDESWDVIMKVHVRAPFRLVRAAAPYFRIKVCHLIICSCLATSPASLLTLGLSHPYGRVPGFPHVSLELCACN